MKIKSNLKKPSFIFASLGFILFIPVVFLVWLIVNFNNTDNFVNTIAPIAKSPSVQKYASERFSLFIVNSVPTEKISNALSYSTPLPDVKPEWIKVIITPVVQDGVNKLIASKQFYNLWSQSLYYTHKGLLIELNSKPLKFTDVNFKDLATISVGKLNNSDISSITSNIHLNKDIGIVKLDLSKIQKIRNNYHGLINTIKLVTIFTILCFVLSIYFAKNRYTAIKKITLIASVLLLAFNLSIRITPNFINTNNIDQTAAFRSATNIVLGSLNNLTFDYGLILLLVSVVLYRFEKQIKNQFNKLELKIRS